MPYAVKQIVAQELEIERLKRAAIAIGSYREAAASGSADASKNVTKEAEKKAEETFKPVAVPTVPNHLRQLEPMPIKSSVSSNFLKLFKAITFYKSLFYLFTLIVNSFFNQKAIVFFILCLLQKQLFNKHKFNFDGLFLQKFRNFFENFVPKADPNKQKSPGTSPRASKSIHRVRQVLTKYGIWYKYKEGFSNSVRRDVKMSDLL